MATITLTRGLLALVDDADRDLISGSGPWHAYPSGRSTHYARHSISPSRQISMHSLLTGWPLVDHINGDGLDNRRSNLRLANASTNLANRGPQANNTSGYKGVTRSRTGRWIAQIRVRGHGRTIGTFDMPADAARAYDIEALLAWGEFARLNFPMGESE